mmetsp:Transcript_19810/g.42611  ORF Transcript_19810/g.42611 Transcript_19810/m.42611 type:complete len:95 (+) Transcript_19810:489-773(+)
MKNNKLHPDCPSIEEPIAKRRLLIWLVEPRIEEEKKQTHHSFVGKHVNGTSRLLQPRYVVCHLSLFVILPLCIERLSPQSEEFVPKSSQHPVSL